MKCCMARCTNQIYKNNVCKKHNKWLTDNKMAFPKTRRPGKAAPHKCSIATKLKLYSHDEYGCRIWHRWEENGNPKVYINDEYGKRIRSVRRVAFELAKHPIPYGHFVVDTCGRSLCINPDHLFLVKRENKRYTAKLTADQVMAIKLWLATGSTYDQLAKEYNVNRATIYSIATGRTWKEV